MPEIETSMPRIVATFCEGQPNPLGLETPIPRLTWQLEAVTKQRAYQIQVASGRDLLAKGQADLWDSGRVESSQSVFVPYEGQTLSSRQRAFWRVRVWNEANEPSEYSEIAWWEMGLLQRADWSAQWIGSGATLSNYQAPVLPAPLFRKVFSLSSQPASARVYVCGLGYFELYLNGQRVGDHVLDPIVTQYEKHVGYVTHDVSELIQSGENAVALMLGNGWYNSHSTDVWHYDKAPWRDYPKLLLQLEVTHEDGHTERISSNGSWRVADGPLRYDGYRNGEIYDAREEKTGWNTAEFDDSDWKQAQAVAGPGGQLFSQQAPPCRVVETLEAVSITEVREGVWVFDFGQNIAGWGRLQVSGQAGDEVMLRYSEVLTEGGEVDQYHISLSIKDGPFQTDHYTLAGHERECFETRFTYHGFQWVQVEGLRHPPDKDTLKAQVVQSDFAPVGQFASSDETLNSLQSLTLRSYRSNFVGIPTDCPHREKNGWTADAQLACETGLYNFAPRLAYEHWLQTLADAQRGSGQLPGVAPTGGWGFNWGNGPAWDTAIVTIPWQMYLFYGDEDILHRLYHNMKAYLEYAFGLADVADGLPKYGLGDWCAHEMEKTAERELVNTAILVGDCQTVSKIARLFGQEEEEARFEKMGQQLRMAWRTAFVKTDGSIANNEQTSLGCALHYGLLEASERPAVIEGLLRAVAEENYHPTFGILGAKWVTRALAEAGYANEAFKIIRREEYPGWVHWLRQGATTLWEEWHGMTSRNHVMFGDISAWMYAYLSGIRPLESHPGFKQFRVAPQLVDSLEWARAEHLSAYGSIKSEWQRQGDQVHFTVIVPANTTAFWSAPIRDASSQSVQELPTGTHNFTIDNSELA